MQFSPSPCYFIYLPPNILLNNSFSNNLNLCYFFWKRSQVSHLYQPTGKVIRFLVYFFTGSTAPWLLASDVQFHYNFTDGRTPWTSVQPVARPLPKHRITQTQNKHTHTHIQNIHASCGIQTHDPGLRASEDSACLRPLGYRDRRFLVYTHIKYASIIPTSHIKIEV
jgi:hypothetical protein